MDYDVDKEEQDKVRDNGGNDDDDNYGRQRPNTIYEECEKRELKEDIRENEIKK